MMRITAGCQLRAVAFCVVAVSCNAQQLRVGTLATAVGRYEVRDVAIEEALKELVGSANGSAVVGFERVPAEARSPAREPKISINIDHGTVQDVLQQICAGDSRYTFSDAGGGVIDVYPVLEASEAAALLNLALPRVDIKTREWPWNLFAQLPDLAPELSAYLSMRSQQYLAQTHGLPRGSPGIIMMNKGDAPEVEIQLKNTTVRGLLNALAAYTLTHVVSKQGGVSQTVPLGWEFEFTIDPRADTGMGGYPKWKPFPFP
jgi:hypothetical protein